MPAILIQLADPNWTREAMHAACALARNTRASVTLLMCERVAHIGLLGTDVARAALTAEQYALLSDLEAVAEDYGVPFSVSPMCASDFSEALLQAAEYLHPSAVFAPTPHSAFGLWSRLVRARMAQRLHAAGSQWFDLAQPQPAISLTPAPIA